MPTLLSVLKGCILRLKDLHSPIHGFNPPLITWSLVPVMVEFASVSHTRSISVSARFRSTFAAGAGKRALSGIILSLVKIVDHGRGIPPPPLLLPRARRDRCGRIRRWLPQELVRYQETRRLLQRESGKEKGRERVQANQGNASERKREEGKARRGGTQAGRTRRRKGGREEGKRESDSWWGCWYQQLKHVGPASRSVVLSQ